MHLGFNSLICLSRLLRVKAGSTLLDEFPNGTAYIAHGEARPPIGAFAAQLAAFEANQ